MGLRRAAVAALLCAMVLSGCSSDVIAQREPTGRASGTASPSSMPTGVVRAEPIPRDLLVGSQATEDRILPVLDELDLNQAVDAPTVVEAPVPRALLVSQLSPFSPEPDTVAASVVVGRPYLLTPSGEWRRVEPSDYGLPAHVEQPVALSRDGRSLALAGGDPARLVVLDLASGRVATRSLPSPAPVGLRWSHDGSEISWFDRADPAVTYRYRVSTARIVRSTIHSLRATYVGVGSAIVEVRPSGSLRFHGDADAREQALEHPRLARGGAQASGGRFVAWARSATAEVGVVVVDPGTGRLQAALTAPDERRLRLSPGAWLSPDDLLLTQWSTGSIFVWNVLSREVVRIGRFATRGVALQVAGGVLGELIG